MGRNRTAFDVLLVLLGTAAIMNIFFLLYRQSRLVSSTFQLGPSEKLLNFINQTNNILKKELIATKQIAERKHNILNSRISPKKLILKTASTPVDNIEKEYLQSSSAQRHDKNVAQKKVLIFTMDSISSFEQNSLKGGAAGELIIRHSLEFALNYFHAIVKVARSDEEFSQCDLGEYDIVILDPWTWAAKGWVPKSNIRGHDSKVYILDFFGSKKLKGRGLSVPPSRFLTAFGAEGNSFLGYFMNNSLSTIYKKEKKEQGVIWGKDPKHFKGKETMLRAAAKEVPLVSTASKAVFNSPNIKWIGHQSPSTWLTLLSDSKFMIGLGDPILGPSAIDAISVGCMFINPVFPPGSSQFKSQHPFAARLGEPHVCNYHQSNINELIECVKLAKKTTIQPFLPEDLTLESYLRRVKSIFNL